MTLGGSLQVELTAFPDDLEETFIVAGVPTTLTLDGGPYVRVTGTGLELDVLGQRITGDLVVTRAADSLGRPTLRVEATHLRLVLGSGAATATATQEEDTTAVLVLTASGVAFSVDVDVVLSVPGVSLTGDLAIEVDTTRGFVRVAGDDVSLSVLGQTLVGDVTVEQLTTSAGRVVTLALADVGLDLAGVATVSEGAGVLLLTTGGVAGSLSAKLAFGDDDVLSVTGTFGLAVNTTGAAVRRSVVVGGRTVLLDLPAGPYLRVSGTDVVVKAAGQVLSGDVTVEKTGGTLHVTAARVRLQIGDGNRALVRLTDGAADLTVVQGTSGASVTGSVSGTWPS